ncbi:sensor domain-containing diguanylate cyclase [Vibrio tubiashii]|uniref:sensor domain-containing diguanylate cyclase n=1 Tax=Vibrio tubiashii TaxID=29498 RepID=UPI001EFCAA1B|nr:sensor domain-containing diguanylate cyclase [Vibrio tubiashii]MCG9580960.1 sensor domain-containing diguanylate cyclase [Vibrio tubiashii]MCG9614551.1 sensor domain-containing diguanylate cyclase [Vibrio tubiashii]MCG9689310.1 sensor domain-containing diguanylate cyclase [Vibrio tubiashii]
MISPEHCVANTKSDFIDLDKWQELVDLLSELYGASTGAIVQLRQGEFNVVVSSQNEDNFLPRNTTWPWEMKSFCRHIMETRDDLYVGCAVEDANWLDAPAVAQGPVRSYCGAPILWPNGELFGTICVIDTKETVYPLSLSKLLEQLARLIASDIQTACRLQEAENMALTDELTGLLNRRGYTLLGEQKLKDAPRYHQNIGLLYIDIDNLKKVNDTHGHEFGDIAITSVANILQTTCRPSDIIARIGGDEFAILTLVSKRDELTDLSKTISNRYSEKLATAKELDVTDVSIGIHFAPCERGLCLQSLISLADNAMYHVKSEHKALS